MRLTDEEIYMRDQLAEMNGIDGSGVFRMALRKLAKAEGVPPYVPAQPTALEKKKGRRPKNS